MKKLLSVVAVLSMICLLSAPVFAATCYWTGASPDDNNWSTSSNWDPGHGSRTPISGDDLAFDGAPARTTSTNDQAAGFTISGIEFAYGTDVPIVLNGNAITLTGDIFAHNNHYTATPQTVSFSDIMLGASVKLRTYWAVVSSSMLVTSNIDTNGFILTNQVAQGSNITVSGIISGTGSLSETTSDSPTGALTLSGANTYSGGTTLTAGTLNINHATALGTGTVHIDNGATIDCTKAGGISLTSTGAETWDGDFTFKGTNNLDLGTGTVALGAATRTVTTTANTLSVGGIISSTGAFGLIKAGAGALTLSGANTYSGGTTLTSGTLNINHATALGTGTVHIDNGTTIDCTKAGGIVLTSTGAETWDGNFIFTGTNNLDLGTGTVALGAATRTVTTTANTLTVGGVVGSTGAFGLTKTGAGALTLTGANTYTGATTINAGTLTVGVAGVGSITNSAVTVNNTGTLKGSGTTGAVTINSGGTISPGNSVGTINNTGTVTYNGGGKYVWEINDATGTAGTSPGWDLQNITGGLTIASAPGNTFAIDITSLAGSVSGNAANFNKLTGYTWTITSASTGIGGFDVTDFTLNYTSATFKNDISGATSNGFFDIQISDNDLQLRYNAAVDAPATAYWTDGENTQLWNTKSGGNTTNWDTTSGGGIDTGSIPGTATDVHFYATSAGNFVTTLGQDFTIKSLTMDGGTATSAVSIAAGNTLTINAGGITINSGAGALTINSGVVLGASQAWLNNSANLFTVAGNVNNGTNTLTVDGNGATSISGVISNGALTKTGTGILTLIGANTYTGATTVNSGTLQAGVATTAFGVNSAVTMANLAGAILDLNDFSQTIGSLNGGGAAGGNIDLGTGTLTTGALNIADTYDGVISGTGGLTKAGTNTQTLTRANTYTGATTINKGTLAAGVDSVANISGAFGKNSAVVMSTTDATAVLDITGHNTQIGSLTGGGTGFGGVTLGAATLTVGGDDTSPAAYAGAIAGTGAVTKIGTGTQTLSGSNTYTGLTTVTAGELDLNNATGDSIVGNLTVSGGTAKLLHSDQIYGTRNIVVSGGIFDLGAFNESVTNVQLTTNGSITGTGGVLTSLNDFDMRKGSVSAILAGAVGLNKTTSDIVTLSGVNTYTGATAITAGTLKARNASAFGTAAGTTNVTVSNAGTTLDIGTTALAFGGTYLQNLGSTLSLAANSATTFGSITSTGTATINDGTGLINVTVGGYIPSGTILSIVNGAAGSACTVPNANITSSNPNVSFTGATSGNNFVLTAKNTFSNSATNSNAATVGAVLSNITTPSADMTAVLNALTLSTPGQVASSESSMTPTNDGATTESAAAMLNQFVNNLATHLENTRTTGGATGIATGDDYLNGIDIWAQGLGDYAHQDPRGTSQGYNATSWGISGGLDKSLCNDSFRTGLGTGYGQTFVRSKDFSGRTDINSIPATIYCDYENNNLPFYIDTVFTFVYNLYNGSRQVTAGIISRTANADYNGQQYSGYVEGGYSFFYKKISLTPLVSFQYMHLHTGSYSETNAGALSLSVASQDYDTAQTGLGAKIARPFEQGWGTFTPDFHFRWLYDWIGDNQATTAGFAGGGTSFGTNGFSPAQSAYDFGAKLDFKTKYNVTIGLDYDFLFKADYYEHYGTIDVKYSF